MSDITIQDFDDSRTDELLAFLTRWSADHPELGEGDIIRWQKCDRFMALHEDRIVGYIAQIPHQFRYGAGSGREGAEQIGWAVTLVLNMSDDKIRRSAGRGLLTRCEQNPPWQYAGVGMVPGIEKAYIRRGHAVRTDCSRSYARLLQPEKALAYEGKSLIYAPAIRAVNALFRASRKPKHGEVRKIDSFKPEWDARWDDLLSRQYELYGKRDAEYLNHKLAQPNRDYHVYTHSDGGYIVFRQAIRRTGDLNLVKVCDLVGTPQARADLLTFAVKYTYDIGAYGVVAMGAASDRGTYRKAGLYISRRYPIVMSPEIKARMHISFFDSDLDNLW